MIKISSFVTATIEPKRQSNSEVLKEFDNETIITESAKAEDKNIDNIESEYNFL